MKLYFGTIYDTGTRKSWFSNFDKFIQYNLMWNHSCFFIIHFVGYKDIEPTLYKLVKV